MFNTNGKNLISKILRILFITGILFFITGTLMLFILVFSSLFSIRFKFLIIPDSFYMRRYSLWIKGRQYFFLFNVHFYVLRFILLEDVWKLLMQACDREENNVR